MTPAQQTALETLAGRAFTSEDLAVITPLVDTRNDAAVAEHLSIGRTKVVSRLISDGTVATYLGVPGMVFLLDLEEYSKRTLNDSATQAEKTPIAAARQAWRSITKGELDIGLTSVRSLMALFVGTLIDQGTYDSLLALAVQPDPLPVSYVSSALSEA